MSETIQKHLSTFQILLICGNAAFACFFWGYCQTVFNSLSDTYSVILNLDDQEFKLFAGISNGVIQGGAGVGALMAGQIISNYGKRQSMIVIDFLCIGATLLTLSTNVYIFIIARTFQGIYIGINSSIVPVYIREISPSSISGQMGSLIQNFINFGMLFNFVLGLNLPSKIDFIMDSSNQWWKFMLLFPILVILIRMFILLLVYKFETPAYLIENHEFEKASDVINSIYHIQYRQQQYDCVKEEIDNKQEFLYQELVSPKYRIRMIIGLALGLLQQATGIIGVLGYSNDIFKDSSSENTARLFSFLVSLCFIVSTQLSGFFIDSYGRKTLLVLGTTICVVTEFFIAVFGQLDILWIQKYLILMFILGFGLSLGPIVWLYLAEILPPKGTSLAGLHLFLWATIVAIIFPFMKESLGIFGCFYLFSGLSFLGLIFILIYVKETKGKNNKEIDQLFINDSQPLLQDY